MQNHGADSPSSTLTPIVQPAITSPTASDAVLEPEEAIPIWAPRRGGSWALQAGNPSCRRSPLHSDKHLGCRVGGRAPGHAGPARKIVVEDEEKNH